MSVHLIIKKIIFEDFFEIFEFSDPRKREKEREREEILFYLFKLKYIFFIAKV